MATQRRTFLLSLAAGLAAPRLARSQAARPMLVVVLFAGEAEDDEPGTRAFFEEMRRLGWAEGGNVIYERLSGRGTREYVATLAASVAGRKPDLIFATTASGAMAVVKEAASVPIVFSTTVDPVAVGLAQTLARPGRNASGVHQAPGDVAHRRFELVRETMPGVRRVGVVLDRRSNEFARQKAAQVGAAQRVGIGIEVAEFTNFEAVAKILSRFRRDGIAAVVPGSSFSLFARRRQVCAAAERLGLALFAHRVEWADAGALLSYGGDVAEALRRAARIADRVLKGTRPAEIPVERASGTELVVNLRVAKALGLTLPKTLLQHAARVIE